MNNHAIIDDITAAFEQLNINIIRYRTVEMPSSITNHYMMAEDNAANSYLVRLNGKLWSPFSRKNESKNLLQLKSIGFNPFVIYEDINHSFQISILPKKQKNLDYFKNRGKTYQALSAIAKSLKRLHASNYFDNHFRLVEVIENSFRQLPYVLQEKLYDLFKLILRIVAGLNQKDNFVPSHNDLLPSSIYIDNEKAQFVDFEYSGNNLRAYDLAFLSIKSKLTETEESKLVSYYDSHDQYKTKDSLTTTKPVVYFLLFLWSLASKPHVYDEDYFSVLISVQTLLFQNLFYQLCLEDHLSNSLPQFSGIYWGTFDPPTVAHLNIVITALQKFNLSKLIIVINDNSATKKKYNISGEERSALWNAMITDLDLPSNWKDRICIVCQTDENPFSYETAKEQNPQQKMIAIVGQDSFNGFKKYKDALRTYDHILVVPRGEHHLLLQDDIDELNLDNISMLPITDTNYLTVSSTQARAAIAIEDPVAKKLLHTKALEYIRNRGLFAERKCIGDSYGSFATPSFGKI